LIVVNTVKACLQAMTILLQEGLEFRKERLAQAVTEDFSNATDVADYLAARGVPFREAYNLVGKVVKTSIACRETPQRSELGGVEATASSIRSGHL
jgi:argininosuccinate lyase